MTPKRIVDEALKKGLDIIAITDNNSIQNNAAILQAAQGLPITVIPGVEVTTSEEIHVICLFPDLDSANQASQELETHFPHIENNKALFGQQLIIDESDNVIGNYPYLLQVPLDISIDELPCMIDKFGGICYPAHIDRASNSILSTLGSIPESLGFASVEIFDTDHFYGSRKHGRLGENFNIISSSNAHSLNDIAKNKHFIGLDEPSFGALKRVLSSENRVSCK